MRDAWEMLSNEGQEPEAYGFICPQGHLHIIFSWKKARPKAEVMGERLDTSQAKLPPPEPALFEKMAGVGQECFETLAEQGLDDTDIWYSVARTMYCTLAKVGGAKTRVIRERTSG